MARMVANSRLTLAESFCCVIEQDILSIAQPRMYRPDMTEKVLTGT